MAKTRSSEAPKAKWFDPMGIYAKEDEEIAQRKSPSPGKGPTREDLRKMAEVFRPTEADLKRVYTEEEFRHLCLVKKVKVRMDWFNPVETFMRRWRKEGRVERWSPELLTRMLNKAILRNYDYMNQNFVRKQFDDEREFYRRELKRHHNVYLDGWHRSKEEARENIDSNVPSQSRITVLESNPIVFSEETQIGDEFLATSQTINLNSDSDLDDTDLENPDKNWLKENSISSSAETDVNYNSKGGSFHNNTIEIYTESFFETDISYDTQSQPVQNSEVLPYEAFGTQIPLTSTQSQSQSQH